jgi:integrase
VGYPATGKSFPTKLAAELWAARTEAARKGRAIASARGMTLGHLLDEALITPELIAHHRDRLLGADCRGHNYKSTKPRSPATVRNYLIELSRLFALAVKELRVIDANPCARVTKPKASTEVVRWLTDDERTALLAACKGSDSPDLYPFMLFALTTGARKGEIAALEWAQVDLNRRWATFPRTKNGDARGVPLTTAVCALLRPARALRRLCSRSTSRRGGTRPSIGPASSIFASTIFAIHARRLSCRTAPTSPKSRRCSGTRG